MLSPTIIKLQRWLNWSYEPQIFTHSQKTTPNNLNADTHWGQAYNTTKERSGSAGKWIYIWFMLSNK